MRNNPGGRWPKILKPLTPEQIKAQKDFMHLWHEVLPRKYGLIEKFNHANGIIQKSVHGSPCHTLEIGAGLGEHLEYEDLKNQDYTTLEIRSDFVDKIRSRFPTVKSVVGDIQKRTPFADEQFDRILAIHVLEHLPDLPAALHEIKRILKPDGVFVPVIPCEGGLAYSLARRISAQRIFEKQFKMPYGPIIANEHVSQGWEILEELKSSFTVEKTQFWPLIVPITTINLVMALSCKKAATHSQSRESLS